MRRMMLAFVFAAAATAGAAAHESALLTDRPYVIEKTCGYDFKYCDVRMNYAPGQHAGLAGSGSYWYRKANRHHWRHSGNHAGWCLSRYRTYDAETDTYVGKGYTRKRCNSPFDGR